MTSNKRLLVIIGLVSLTSSCIETRGPEAGESAASGTGGRLILRGKPVVVKEGEAVKGDLTVVEGEARVDGEVQGDLTVLAGTLRVGPKALIKGDIVAIGNEVTEVAPGARVLGSRVTVEWAGVRWIVRNIFYALENPVLVGSTAGLAILVALVVFWLLVIRRYHAERFHLTVEQQPIRTGLLGLVVVIGLHTLTLLMFLLPYTVGLVPVLMLVLVTLSFVGWLLVAGHVGRAIALRKKWAVKPFWYGLLGIGVCCGAFLIPIAGQIANLLASWIGIGAILNPVAESEIQKEEDEGKEEKKLLPDRLPRSGETAGEATRDIFGGAMLPRPTTRPELDLERTDPDTPLSTLKKR